LDGAIWGGEFFEGSIRDGFERRAHLAYAPLPGSEAAIRQPWRAAIGQLTDLYGQEAVLALPLDIVRMAKERNIRLISQIVEHRVNCPVTSSAGRLFDVVSALIGVPGSWRITYEGQAAIELEMVAAGRASEGYPVLLRDAGEEGWVVETRPIIDAVLDDMLDRKPASEISARFHRTMAEIVVTTCMRIRESGGLSAVALSGGTFQNALLFEQVLELLIASGFIVYRHRRVPANDGGLSLGQAVIASQFWREG